jgi:hypothetical protein
MERAQTSNGQREFARCPCRLSAKNYLVESFFGVLEGALLGLEGEGEDGLAEGGVERDMLLEPLGLVSFFDSCDDDDWDGAWAFLPGLFVRSQAASVNAPTLRAMRSLVALRVMVRVSLSGQETLSKHRAKGISQSDQRVGRPKCRLSAPVSGF